MKHIVVEGMDASGKSTLLTSIIQDIPWRVQVSEGPPRYAGEMDHRVTHYLNFQSTLFDRHPCVSQPIYGTLRSHNDEISPELLRRFYESRPIFIYCDPLDRGMRHHTRRSAVDTDAHLAQVEEHYHTLLTMYRAWAIKHAHFIYRIGDDTLQLNNALKGAIS